MKFCRRLIACYLALCFAFAGAVGVSPFLHRLIEHGGQGPDHTHNSFASHVENAAPVHEHGDGRWHSLIPERPRPTGPFAHSYKPFELPTIPLGRLLHAFSHFLAGPPASESAPSKDKPGHEHHSLFQLIANGLVDQPLDVPLLSPIPFAFVAHDIVANTVLAVRDWDAQTASRAPPQARG